MMNDTETVQKTAQQILEIPSQEEVAQALASEEQPAEIEVASEEHQQLQEEIKQSPQAKNFAALREKAERAERERDEALRILREVESSSRRNQPLPIEEDDSISIGPDDLAEGKHLSKVQQKIKKLEKQLKDYEQKATESMLETQLRVNYPDFNVVVSRENLELLRNEYPEIAATINSSQDHYSRAAAAYKLIKKLGINQTVSYDADKLKVHQNAQKPRPLASVSPQRGDSPLSRANAFADGKLSDELAKQLFKEMNDARKGY
jgi:hypothetical protein